MSRKEDLTQAATQGYNSPETHNGNPYIYSSSNWFAFVVGAYLKRTGRTAPRGVRMGRGYQVHANDMLLAVNEKHEVTRVG